MVVQIDTQKAKILKKLNSFFDFDMYTDHLLLDSQDFLVKYDFGGWSFQNYVCVRFSEGANIFKEIHDFLPDTEYYLIPILKEPTNIFKMERKEITAFLNEANISDFVVFESKLTWLLVYDRHRKLFGSGNYIKKKINQNVNLRFGNARIMFTHTDKL